MSSHQGAQKPGSGQPLSVGLPGGEPGMLQSIQGSRPGQSNERVQQTMFVTGLDPPPLPQPHWNGARRSGSKRKSYPGERALQPSVCLHHCCPCPPGVDVPKSLCENHQSDEEWAPLGWGTCLAMLAWDSTAFLLPTLHSLILRVQGTDVDGSLLTFSSPFRRAT